MWRRIRNTIGILAAGTLIGILLGTAGGKTPSSGRGGGDTIRLIGESAAEAEEPLTQTVAQESRPAVTPGTATGYGYTAPVMVEESAPEQSGSMSALLAERERLGITDAAVEARMLEEHGHYCYDAMDPALCRLYVELLLILEAHAEDVLVSAADAEELSTAFMCVFQDHPELYYFDGYYYRRYENSAAERYYTFGARYTYTAEECAAYAPRIGAYLRGCLSGIPAGADDYTKSKYIYEYVILHTDYDMAARDNQNILSVMLYGRSVCQGYAKTVQYLLQEAGLSSAMVVGEVYGGTEGHAWNLVQIDGAYYYLDATWGDSAYLRSHGESTDGMPEINYRFLNVTSEDLAGTHRPQNVVSMPYCVSTDANYYVREGRYLAGYDEESLRRFFTEAAADGSRSVSIKLSSSAVYEQYRERLLRGQEVFGLLPEEVRQIDYNEEPEMRILSFWF